MMSNVERIDSYIGDLESGDKLFIYSLEPVSKIFYKIRLAMICYDEGRYRVAIAGESKEERRIMIYADALKLTEVETESGDWIRLECISLGFIVARFEFRILYRAKIRHADGEEGTLYEYDGGLEISSLEEGIE